MYYIELQRTYGKIENIGHFANENEAMEYMRLERMVLRYRVLPAKSAEHTALVISGALTFRKNYT